MLPEFQKALVGRATPEQAVDAMMKGLEAASEVIAPSPHRAATALVSSKFAENAS